jgi:putative membrane protein
LFLYGLLGETLKKHSKKSSDLVILFFKGVFMGAADIIPGISGGTIALITGIYEQLIDAIKSVDLLFIPYFFKGFIQKKYFTLAKKNFLAINFSFLLPLMAGIAVAFLAISNIISPLFEYYPSYLYAFFFGLILASSLLVFHSMGKITIAMPFFMLFGFFVGFFVVGLDVIQANHSLPILFLSGVITICAMILPGISGAFILLLLGQYVFMLDVLRGFTRLDFSGIFDAVAYISGGIVGVLLLSRLLSYLITKYRLISLSFLVGLMLGALRKPAEHVFENPGNPLLIIFSSIIGILIIIFFVFYKYHLKKDILNIS